jgi:hypothetical protein
MPKAVILTAIPIEYAAVRAHLQEIEELIHPMLSLVCLNTKSIAVLSL